MLMLMLMKLILSGHRRSSILKGQMCRCLSHGVEDLGLE